MNYKNLYEVTFNTKKGGWSSHLIHVEAFNIKEAKEIAKNLWYKNYKSHMFGIKIRRVAETEVVDMKHWFGL